MRRLAPPNPEGVKWLTAGQKWLGLFLDVLGWELQHTDDGQLLSEWCDGLIRRHPVAGRVAIISVGALLTAHLANLLDPEYDPLAKSFWRRVLNRRI